MLNVNTSTTFKNIPSKILKQNSDIGSPYLLTILNSSIQSKSFPDQLKLADITTVFKKEDATSKSNYRPI